METQCLSPELGLLSLMLGKNWRMLFSDLAWMMMNHEWWCCVFSLFNRLFTSKADTLLILLIEGSGFLWFQWPNCCIGSELPGSLPVLPSASGIILCSNLYLKFARYFQPNTKSYIKLWKNLKLTLIPCNKCRKEKHGWFNCYR